MAYEPRGRRQYFYRKEREGDCVRSIYVGAGRCAELHAWEMQDAAAKRRARREAIDADRAAQAEIAAALAAQDRLVQGLLATEGIHYHRGEWRSAGGATMSQADIDAVLGPWAPPIRPQDVQPTVDGLIEMLADAKPLDEEQVAELDDLLHRARARETRALMVLKQVMRDEKGRAALLVATDPLLQMAMNRAVDRHGVVPDLEQERFTGMLRQLGYGEAPIEEQLLIQKLMLCWADYLVVVEKYKQNMENATFAAGAYWERRLSAVSRRLDQAVKTLVDVRRLAGRPPIQVNIAAHGGQQVVNNE